MSIKVESTSVEPKETVVAPKGESVSEDTKDVEQISASAEKQDESAEESETSDEPEKSEQEESEGEEAVAAKPKKSKGFKDRIDKLRKKISATEQEKEYWRTEALKKQTPVQEKQSTEPKKLEVSGKPKTDDFETHDEYVEALTDWKLEQKLTLRDSKQKEVQVKTEHQKLIESHVEKVKTFAADHEDFHEAMESVDEIKMSITVEDAILQSDNGPELMYALAKAPEEFARICKLPPLAAARAIGKFEAALAAPPEKTTETKTTKAPRPINPVGTASTGSGKKSIFDPSLSQQEYERIRREQQAKRA